VNVLLKVNLPNFPLLYFNKPFSKELVYLYFPPEFGSKSLAFPAFKKSPHFLSVCTNQRVIVPTATALITPLVAKYHSLFMKTTHPTCPKTIMKIGIPRVKALRENWKSSSQRSRQKSAKGTYVCSVKNGEVEVTHISITEKSKRDEMKRAQAPHSPHVSRSHISILRQA